MCDNPQPKPESHVVKCATCKGTGRILASTCTVCKGVGSVLLK
jgi:DnaJ-class molecular chaperone